MTQSAVSAVRDDVSKLKGAFDRGLASRVTVVASVLQGATSGPRSNSKRLQRAAFLLARRALGRHALARGCQADGHAAETPTEVFRLVAEKISDEGFFALGRAVLEAQRDLSERQEDRLMLQLDIARSWRREGYLDLAEAQLRLVNTSARRLHSVRLESRALVALAACAQMRGNIKKMKALARRGALMAERAGLDRIAASAYLGLGAAHGMTKEYEKAVVSLWIGYQRGRSDRAFGTEALANLCQALLMAGFATEARGLAASLLRRRLPPKFALPVLGAYAVASATEHDDDAVIWAASEARNLREGRRPREEAMLMIECGIALTALGYKQDGTEMVADGERAAVDHGFFDMTFREGLEMLTTMPRPRVRANSQVENVLREVRVRHRSRPRTVVLSGV